MDITNEESSDAKFVQFQTFLITCEVNELV